MKINNSIKTIIVTGLLFAISTPQVYSMKRFRKWIENINPLKEARTIDPQSESSLVQGFNKISPDAASHIFSFLDPESAFSFANSCRLTRNAKPHSNLGRFKITNKMFENSFQELVDFLGQQHNLEHLDLAYSKINDDQLQHILNANAGRLRQTLRYPSRSSETDMKAGRWYISSFRETARSRLFLSIRDTNLSTRL